MYTIEWNMYLRFGKSEIHKGKPKKFKSKSEAMEWFKFQKYVIELMGYHFTSAKLILCNGRQINLLDEL